MFGDIIKFLTLLGVYILKVAGAKAKVRKNVIDWGVKYNTDLFKQSKTLADEYDEIMKDLAK